MNQPSDNPSGHGIMLAGSRSQNFARATRTPSHTRDSGPNKINLKLTHISDVARPQSIRRRPTCRRLAASCRQRRVELFVTSSNHQRYRDLALSRPRSNRTRTRTTTDGVRLRVEGPKATTTTNGGQPFCCGNILLPLIAVTLLLVTAQTFAFAASGVHDDDQRLQRATSLSGHTRPQQRHQQVDARLILEANESGRDGAAPKGGKGEEKIQRASAASEHATLVKRSNADQLSSAELPAEFRGSGGGDEPPKEQSRLARLCEQTSSVLASVLPAPFGGHKRSILCQFFGQVQVGAGGTPASGKQRLSPQSNRQPQVQQQQQYPIPGVSLPPELRFPAGSAQFEVPAAHQESIAILQQSQQPPIAMVATGRHPIQMVLEHQQRHLVANRAPQVSTGWSHMQAQQDLSVESSIQDRRAVPVQELAQHQKPAQKQIKFSAPLASPSPFASGAQMSSGGWRISNGTSAHQETTGMSSSTTPMPRVNQTQPPTVPSSTSEMPAASRAPKTGAVQLSIGKRTSETPAKSTPADARVMPVTGADKSKSESLAGGGGDDRVRTIEVSAQEVAATSDRPVQSRQASHGSDQTSGASFRPNDARQVQKREELVIASINNLTRIAFGNQLRDTVKVINKLIDQQAAVFSGQQHKPTGELASSQRDDPMLTSESVGRPQVMPMLILHHKPAGDKTQDASQLAKKEKLSNSNKEHKMHVKATLTSPKLNSNSLNGAAGGNARDNLKTATARSHDANPAVAATSDQKLPKLGQTTGNNINSKLLVLEREQFTTRQERISSSTPTNKLKSTPTTAATTTTTTASSKLTAALPSGGGGGFVSTKMATSVGGQQKSVASNKKVTSPVKKQQGTLTSPKSGGGAKEPDKRKATNHSQRTTVKSSHSAAGAHARDKDKNQQQLNQSSTASVELRRLTTIGRALIMHNEATADGKHESARPRSRSEMDLALAQTINDLSRPVTSTWLPSRGPAVGPTTLAMRKLHKIKGDSYRRELGPSRPAPTRWTSTSPAMSPLSSWSQAQSSTVTQFPWLLPDKSALASSETGDLAPASSSSSAEVHMMQSTGAHPRASGASSPTSTSTTTRRMVTPYDSDQFSSKFTSEGSSAKQHSPLVLNRIETTRRLDSLTTLKMALTRASRTTSTRRPSETESTTPTRSTPLPFFSAGTTQSRWLPSTAFLAPRQSPIATVATTTTTTAPTTIMRSSSPTLMSPSASSTLEIIANSYGGAPSTVSAGSSTSDLDEARASETVSRYTTHLSDATTAAANEQLGTRRGQHSEQQQQQHQSLPQIANTGDYFSAETIASWPEKYHTMVSQAMSSAYRQPTTASFETTRRNGETYETSSADVATLSRHRLDDVRATQSASETTRPASPLVGVISSNAPGITILPANHKLMASSLSSSSTEGESSAPTQDLRSATQPMDTATVFVSTEAPARQTKQPPLPAPYTLLDQSTMPADGNSSIREISQTTTIGDGETTLAADNSTTSGTDPMRPPYHANYAFGDFQQLSDPTLVLDQNQSRPYVSKKLYELLSPSGLLSSSGQTFAGAAHPARSQRFNWSALKYLAQNLLMATHGRHNATSGGGMKNFTTGEDDEGEPDAANETGDKQQVAGKTDQQRLYDLMTRSSLPPLNDYYELAGLNESTAVGHQLEEPANQLLNSSYQQQQQQQGKGIFERASNLLSEMKQLEQKRAAALMAAFRYQVPGPLIKPWDPIAQSAHHSPGSISKFFSDRLDTSGTAGSGRAAPTSLSPAQLLAALRSALFKQKLVARDELGARLSSSRRRADQIISSERRNDDDAPSPPSTKSRSDDVFSPPHDNSTISLEDLEYILAANETAIGQDEGMFRGGDDGSNSTTLLKTMLGRLFSGGNLSDSPAPANSSGQPERDFHLIDLSAGDVNGKRSQTNEPPAGRPKYIRLLDYQTALTRKPLDDKAKRLFAPTSGGGNGGGQTRQAMAEVLARLRGPTTTGAVTEPSIEFQYASKGRAAVTASESESDQDKPETDSSFDCDGRSAGFYPDAGSLCQTFYHCSSTGHLLTFNCPSSTRFDEKSLKCGPWYEVSCDIGRVRTRRY